MGALATLIAERSARWEPLIERAIFATTEPAEIEEIITGFAADHLGPVAEALFYRSSVGVVAGLHLADGSEAVVKVHRWNVTVERLAAIQRVQSHLARRSLPAPRPLVAPSPLAGGIATAEELIGGQPVDGHDRAVRRSIAEGLWAFVAAADGLAGAVDIGGPLMLRPPGAALWHEPHDLRFDFDATATGAEWIDELASVAQHRLDALDGPVVVGHFDWRVQNLAFSGDAIAAIYDWDSVYAASEPVIVGGSAAQFTCDWTRQDEDTLPSVEEMRSFVRDYELAKGRPFSPGEREIIDAANLFQCAYGARCQHAAMAHDPRFDERSHWLRLLRARGEDCLGAPETTPGAETDPAGLRFLNLRARRDVTYITNAELMANRRDR